MKKILTNVLGFLEGMAVALAMLGGWAYLIDYLTR